MQRVWVNPFRETITMHAATITARLLTALCLLGCAETGMTKADLASDTGALLSDFSTGTASTQTESNDGTNLAQYWDLGGSVWFDGIDPDPKQSELVVTLFSAKPDLESVCTERLGFVVASMPKKNTPKWMTHWWDIQRSDAKCEDAPQSFRLGIGPYDPQLDPALASRGMTSEGLDGAYLQVTDDGPVYVFGVVTRTELVSKAPIDTADTGGAPTDPSAIYNIQGLQLLPL